MSLSLAELAGSFFCLITGLSKMEEPPGAEESMRRIEFRWKFIEDLMGSPNQTALMAEKEAMSKEVQRRRDLYDVFRMERKSYRTYTLFKANNRWRETTWRMREPRFCWQIWYMNFW